MSKSDFPAIRFKEMTLDMFNALKAGEYGDGEFIMIDMLRSITVFRISVNVYDDGTCSVYRCYSGKRSWEYWLTKKVFEDIERRVKKHGSTLYGSTLYGITFIDYEHPFV